MNDKALKIFSGLTEADEELVRDAENYRPRKKRVNTVRRVAAAAAACAVLAVGIAVVPGLLRAGGVFPWNMGDNMDRDPGTASELFKTTGPILPLTVPGGADGITARREVTLDLSRFGRVSPDLSVTVKDSCTLANTTGSDITLTVLYPYMGSLQSQDLPRLTVDGVPAHVAFRSGDIAHQAHECLTYDDYAALLSDPDYYASAFAQFPELETPVTVYEFTNARTDFDGQAATMDVEFFYDPNATLILCRGFNGGRFNYGDGSDERSFFIGRSDRTTRYLAAVGEDIKGMTTQGYADGGCDPGDEIDARVDVYRYETTFDEVLRVLTGDTSNYLSPSLTAEDLYRELRRHFTRAPLGELNGKTEIEFASEVHGIASAIRLNLLELTLTVPAGGSVTVEAAYTKPGDEYFGGYGPDCSVSSFTVAETLGSSLDFTENTVRLINADGLTLSPAKPEYTDGSFTVTAKL